MKTKTKQWVSVLLLCVSLWTLSCNWLKTTSYYEGTFAYATSSVNEILNFFGLDIDLESSVNDTETSAYNSRLGKGLSNLYDALSDDGLSISEWRESMSFLSYVIKRTEKFGFFTYMDDDTVAALHLISYLGYIFTFLYALTIFFAIYAIVNHILKRKNSSIGATICFVIWFIFNFLVVFQFNRSVIENNMLRITGWSILAVVCCIVSSILWSQCRAELQVQNAINDRSLKDSLLHARDKVQQADYSKVVDSAKDTFSSAKEQIHTHIPASWECPACHSRMTAEKKFCSNCGAKRPDPVYCPKCGRRLASQDTFCPDCGTPRPKDSDDSTDA